MKPTHETWRVAVNRFSPADELDGPAEGEDQTTPSPAVALRFNYDEGLVELLKTILSRARCSSSGRGRPLSKIPYAGGWSEPSHCWWVRSTYWEQVREALLNEGVELHGPLAHPGKRKSGFFEEEQLWSVQDCEWR